MYFYSVTNYKTVALHLIIIKHTLTKGLIKLSPGKSNRLETYKLHIHVTLITETITVKVHNYIDINNFLY
jgi:hypothetical protein